MKLISNPKPFPSLPGRPVPTRPPGGCFPIPHFPQPGEKVTLSLKDRFNAQRLPSALQKDLSSLGGAVKLAMAKDATLTRGKDGALVGPEGQPLVSVTLPNGTKAYVDPNTNQYYVGDDKLHLFGSVKVKGPLALPEGVQFSNSHFSSADCRELTRLAHTPIFKKDEFQPSGPRKTVAL